MLNNIYRDHIIHHMVSDLTDHYLDNYSDWVADSKPKDSEKVTRRVQQLRSDLMECLLSLKDKEYLTQKIKCMEVMGLKPLDLSQYRQPFHQAIVETVMHYIDGTSDDSMALTCLYSIQQAENESLNQLKL